MTGRSSTDLTEHVRRIVVEIARRAWIEDSAALAVQAASLTVRGGPVTMLELEVHDGTAVRHTRGPLPGRVFVRQDGKLTGELLVWLTDGFISGLEYAWYTESPPDQLPEIDQLVFAQR